MNPFVFRGASGQRNALFPTDVTTPPPNPYADWITRLLLKIGLALGALAWAAVACGQAPPFDFSTAPYVHSQNLITTGCEAYSGDWAACGQQWGATMVQPSTHRVQMLTGVATSFPYFQPARITITGDCHQSETRLAMSPGAPKWLLTVGTPTGCAASGIPEPAQELQVWKFIGLPVPWQWQGQALTQDPPNHHYDRVRGMLIRINGDVAYISEGSFGSALWTSVDLVTRRVIARGIPVASLPPWNPQTTLSDGYKYRMTLKTYPNTYTISALGTPPQTPVPPTVTITGATPVRSATPIRTATPPSGGCCSPPNVCAPGVPRCGTPTPIRSKTPTRTATLVPSVVASLTPSPKPSAPIPSPSFTPTRIPITASPGVTPTLIPSPTPKPPGGCGNKSAAPLNALLLAALCAIAGRAKR